MTVKLAFETVGSGPPLLVLHGLFGSSGNWRAFARQLAATHTVHSVDLRNHGASPWADSMGYAEMAKDVLQVIDGLGLKQTAVLGHSMGGKTAMALALLHPDRVHRLLVIDIAPVSYADTLTPFAQAMYNADVMAAASRNDVQRRLQKLVPDSGVVPFLMQNLVSHTDHFDWRINLMAITGAMPQLCGFPRDMHTARFERPLTVFAGAQSSYVVAHDGSAFRPMFTRVAVHAIENAGHWVHVDQPAALLAQVKRALRPVAQPAL